jgi:5'-3' exonuclease
MGIPFYFYYLTKKYKDIIVKSLPENINIYAIDFNGIIHPEASKEHNELQLNINLWKKINYYNDLYKPNNVVICIDGVAPLAKIIQQRKRRYLTIYKNLIDKHVSDWDTNAISPGTKFMTSLNDFILNKITKEKKETFIFSGSNEEGEGEHKIFSHLQKLKKIDNSFDELPTVINGLDADLIILSLISGIKNIYLMREGNDNMITYVNIDNLKKSLLDELKPKWNIENDIDLIESYCVMCSILGNDFIPHILTLNIKNNGLNSLIDITTKSINEFGSLVSENKINQDCLTDIFTQISDTEDNDIISEVNKFIEKKPRDFTLKSQEYAIKNKDKLLSDIYNNSKKWRYSYYKTLFDINVTVDSSLISTTVFNYIKGIYWTYNYYKKMQLDYEWFYPYNYPPTTKDISNYLKVNKIPEIINKGSYLSSDIQLLLILPIQSNHLLNDKYKFYTTDYSKGLKHLFPTEFKIQTFLKTHLWECCPILPMINIERIIKINNAK